MAHELQRVRDEEVPPKRVGSAELEQLINSLNDDDRHSALSKSLSITPSWNYAAAQYEQVEYERETQSCGVSTPQHSRVNSLNHSFNSSKRRVSFGVPALQQRDFEQVNNRQLNTRPPPPATVGLSTGYEQSISKHRHRRSRSISDNEPIATKKYSWARSSLMRNNTTPSRKRDPHVSVSPKLSFFGGYSDDSRK